VLSAASYYLSKWPLEAGLISNSRLSHSSIVRCTVETFHHRQKDLKVTFMIPSPPIFECAFILKNRKVLATKLATGAAQGVLIVLLAVTAFAQHAVTITTTSLPNAVIATFYAGTVTAIDGCTPYRWTIVGGSLPPGLSGQASSSTRSYVISGTPIETGSNAFEVQVEGCGGHISEQTYTVQVQQPNYAVVLNWNASTSPDIAGYNVYRSTSSAGPYSKINSEGLVASTTYSDATVATGAIYYYATTAVNCSNEESSYSNQIAAEIP